KDPLMSGQGKTENVTSRTLVVAPVSSERPGSGPTSGGLAQMEAPPLAQTPEMQEEMRKLIDAARSAVADLQAASPQQPQQAPPMPPQPVYAGPAAPPAPVAPMVSPVAQQQSTGPPQQYDQTTPIPAPDYG